jgi:hypothetical protein
MGCRAGFNSGGLVYNRICVGFLKGGGGRLAIRRGGKGNYGGVSCGQWGVSDSALNDIVSFLSWCMSFHNFC